MHDRDVNGDGKLHEDEAYKIVEDQLKSQSDIALYRKVAA